MARKSHLKYCLWHKGWNEIKSIQKMYDLFALVLKIILDHTNEKDFEHYRNSEKYYDDEILKKLKIFFPDMFARDSLEVSDQSGWSSYQSTLIESLEEYISKVEYSHGEEINIYELVLLARQMDRYLAGSFYYLFPSGMDYYYFESLNSNRDRCQLLLLPRLECGWEHKNREKYNTYDMLFYLRYFYYVQASCLQPYVLQNILLRKNSFQQTNQNAELSVAVSPIDSGKIICGSDPYDKEHSKYFSVKPIEISIEDKLKNKIRKILTRASEERADILLFPEMLGTEDILSMMQKELFERSTLLQNEFPKLIVGPTIWGRNRNICSVLDDVGNHLFSQQKHYGADLKLDRNEERAKEDIISDERIYVLHIYGIGRVAILICKDFMMKNYLQIVADFLKVNLVLVPSFSPGEISFQTMISKYKEMDCNVVWLNSCASRWLHEDSKMHTAVSLAFLSNKYIFEREESNKNIHEGSMREQIFEPCEEIDQCDDQCYFTYKIPLDLGEE